MARVVRDLLEDLTSFHRERRVHRDVRPATIVFADGRASLVDHGTARARRGDLSFAFMAPEQVRGASDIDERADIYGIGAVTFHALTGRTPFEAKSSLAQIALKLDREPPTLSEVTGEIWPTAIEMFARRALAREKAGRFPSATEALDAWTRACAPWLSAMLS